MAISEGSTTGKATGATADYVYDALGRRIANTVGTTTTRYLHFADQVLEEQDATGATTATYVYGQSVDDVIAMQRGTTDYYYHADEQGSVFALTDATGAVAERYDYGDYGVPEFYAPDGTARTASAIDNPYLFTGRRYDPESGWYYYRARYLDPLSGQFTTRDPIGLWGDPLNLGNPHAYAGNNPWTLVDPYGLKGFLDRFGSNRARMIDDISFGRYVPESNNALLVAGMADFAAKTCLHIKVQAVDAFVDSLASQAFHAATDGMLGENWADQVEEFKERDPLVYYGAHTSYWVHVGASFAAGGLAGMEAAPSMRSMLPRRGPKVRMKAPRNGIPARASTFDDVPRVTPRRADFTVTESGTVIPMNPRVMRNSLDKNFELKHHVPGTKSKYVTQDARGPLRARFEMPHAADPNFKGPHTPLHFKEHLHLDRRANGNTGKWRKEDTIEYDWPF